MGKYDIEMFEGKGSPSKKYWETQITIANELAEANRLKRIEIKLNDDKLWNEATRQKLTRKELEDQA